MSVEEMCHMIEVWSYQGDYSISQERLDARNKQLDKIIAALKAGQALYDKARECVKELESGYETCGLIVDMKPLIRAYNEATKEG